MSELETKNEIVHLSNCTYKEGDKINLLYHSGSRQTDGYYSIQCPVCKAQAKMED